jgi:hypothetical protein
MSAHPRPVGDVVTVPCSETSVEPTVRTSHYEVSPFVIKGEELAVCSITPSRDCVDASSKGRGRARSTNEVPVPVAQAWIPTLNE